MISCDKRNRAHHFSLFFLLVLMLAVTVVYAQGAGINEHATEIIKTETYLLIVTAGGLVGIIIYIFKDLKSTMRHNHQELKRELSKKVSIQLHNAICDKQIKEESADPA